MKKEPAGAVEAFEEALRRIKETKETGSNTLRIDVRHLGAIPREIGQLAQLRELSITGSRIRLLSPEIGKLTKLEILDVTGNQLTSLPREIARLPCLKTLRVDGNPLPPEILKLGVAGKLIPYLRDLAAAEEAEAEVNRPRPFNEAKLLLVGPGEVARPGSYMPCRAKRPSPSGRPRV